MKSWWVYFFWNSWIVQLVLEYEFHTAQSIKKACCHQHMPTPANINTAAVGIREWKKFVADIALGRKKLGSHFSYWWGGPQDQASQSYWQTLRVESQLPVQSALPSDDTPRQLTRLLWPLGKPPPKSVTTWNSEQQTKSILSIRDYQN